MTFPEPDPRPMPPWLAKVLAPWSDVPHRLRRMESRMATQAQVDQLTTKLTGLRTALLAGDARIQQELERLRGQDVDVSGLEAALNDLSTEVDETVNLVPEPTPEPDPAPAPDPEQPPSDGGVPDVSV